jgi:drug/metabolite transporter (DMT)-like permease
MDKTGRRLRIIAIVLMGLTSAMNILGGAGTSCAAFFTREFPPMWSLYDYKWLYQLFVLVTILIGVAGVWATVRLSRGKANAYRNSIIVLIFGIVVGAIHVYASFTLRGKTTPADMVLIINLITLIYLLILKLPRFRERVDFSETGDTTDKAKGAGVSAIIAGFVVLTTPIWVGQSHIYQGENWVDVLQVPIYISGAVLLIVGLTLILGAFLKERYSQISPVKDDKIPTS